MPVKMKLTKVPVAPTPVNAPIPAASSVYEEHLLAKPVQGSLEVTKKVSGEVISSTEVPIQLHPGVVVNPKTALSLSFKGSRTLNMGDYNSVSIAVMLTAPTEPGSLEQTYDWLSDWVSKKINDAVNDAIGVK